MDFEEDLAFEVAVESWLRRLHHHFVDLSPTVRHTLRVLLSPPPTADPKLN